MDKGEKKFCIFLTALLVSGALAMVLLFAYFEATPVEVTVDDASLERLALAAPAGNGTAASLAYNLSVAVSVRNPNWAMRVWLSAPLDAELRLAGQPFALLRLAGAETTARRIRPKARHVYRAAAAAEGAPVGSEGVAAFRRESAIGVFRLELVVSGEFKYEAHAGSRSTTVSCPLRVPLSTSAAATAFATFERTLPQKCEDASH
ncbi:hypothetical protein QOZ80_1BG0056570 [Eleusine coracana subsp. coracana]|nr:hypothetical protein QOZ80_1BG0056570 [Eleusine coracana subsp. coracana]